MERKIKKEKQRFYLLDTGQVVVRLEETGAEYEYNSAIGYWEQTGIMLRYFLPESANFENYEVITEKIAQQLLNKRAFPIKLKSFDNQL